MLDMILIDNFVLLDILLQENRILIFEVNILHFPLFYHIYINYQH